MRAKRLGLLLLLSCAVGPPAFARAGRGVCAFEVTEAPKGDSLEVTVALPAGVPRTLNVDADARPFVGDVEQNAGDGWRAVEHDVRGWELADCPSPDCRVRYRFALGDAARALDDLDRAARLGSAYLVAPSAWMLAPRDFRGSFRLRVRRSDGEADVTLGGALPPPDAPLSAFGRFRRIEVSAGAARIDVALTASLAVSNAQLRSWIQRNTDAVAAEYGRFPVGRVLLTIGAARGTGVGYGRTLGGGDAAITLFVGRDATEADLTRDWVLAHEMIHLALPELARRYHWLEEGIATYLEPFARARAGLLATREVWAGLVHGLPLGQPETGDRGLDRTPTWGRTYWGGALFCFVADLGIRRRSAGASSLDDALRAIVGAGGSIETSWDLERLLETGDRATGLAVLEDLHAAWAETPVRVDLDAVWQQLGVRVTDGKLVGFDDAAPLAALRRAFTAPLAARELLVSTNGGHP